MFVRERAGSAPGAGGAMRLIPSGKASAAAGRASAIYAGDWMICAAAADASAASGRGSATLRTGCASSREARTGCRIFSPLCKAQDLFAHNKIPPIHKNIPEYAGVCGVFGYISGGARRSRTADEGFADLCLTTWLWRHDKTTDIV